MINWSLFLNSAETAVEQQMIAVAKKAAEQGWGWWRRFIAARPLTGFWGGVALGALLVGSTWWWVR